MIASIGSRILSPRAVLQGVADPNSLENVIPDTYADGAMCWVLSEQGIYCLDKTSTASVSAPDVIATARGAGVPGRWFLYAPTGGSGAMPLFWESVPGNDGEYMWPFTAQTPDAPSTANPGAGAIVAPRSGTLRHLTVQGSNEQPSSTPMTVTVTINGTPTTITVTLAEHDTAAVDDTHTASVTRGDFVAVLLGAPSGFIWKAALELA